jgi:hypothetical protein
LPLNFTKLTDTRSKAFINKWGDVAVELDALPVEVLRDRIITEVETRMDLDALSRMRRREGEERQQLAAMLEVIGDAP